MSWSTTPEYYRERNAKRQQDPEYRAQHAKRNQEWHQKNKTPERRARKSELMRIYRIKHADRHKARDAVNKAIEAGILTRQPCEVCASFPTHGHHDDYGQPLNVRWLCPQHHREHHAKDRASAEAAAKGAA